MGRRENLENCETYLALPERAVKEKINLGAFYPQRRTRRGKGGGGGVGGEGGSPKKISLQFADSKSQQQSPLVAFLATTLLVSGKPEGPFCLYCTFIFRNEKNWMKKSARVSEKLVSPGFIPGLQVATRLEPVHIVKSESSSPRPFI